MALWDKLKTELDRAGRVAQGALDEGKLRLEIFRVRQLADKAASALGYAVYRARQKGEELDAETYARLSSTLAAHEAEAARLEGQLAEATGRRAEARRSAADRPADGAAGGGSESAPSGGQGASEPPPPAAGWSAADPRGDAAAAARDHGPPQTPQDGPI